MTDPDEKTRKTYKREFAAILMAFWAGMTVWGVYDVRAEAAASAMFFPLLAFNFGAFGLDAYAKQLKGE